MEHNNLKRSGSMVDINSIVTVYTASCITYNMIYIYLYIIILCNTIVQNNMPAAGFLILNRSNALNSAAMGQHTMLESASEHLSEPQCTRKT